LFLREGFQVFFVECVCCAVFFAEIDINGDPPMRKIAMDMFRNYKQPVDKNGNPLRKDRSGKWVDAEGKPVAGTDPVERMVQRPVMTMDDLKLSTPILGKVLDLPKYADLIKELRDATEASKSGVVNFVVGSETEMADAVLKAAFPPGSGVVYRGVDGYGIDCATWGAAADAARGSFQQIIRGMPKVFSRDDINVVRQMSQAIPGLASLWGGEQEAPVRRQIGGRPAAQPEDAGEQASALDNALKLLEDLHNTLDQVKAQLRVTDRYSSEPGTTRTADGKDIKDTFPQSEKFKILQQSEIDIIARMRNIQRTLPKFTHWFGKNASEYDGSGFMDFQSEASSIVKSIMRLLQPKKLMESGRSLPQFRGSTPEDLMDKVYTYFKNDAKQALDAFARGATLEVRDPIKRLSDFLGQDNKTILTSLSTLKKLTSDLVRIAEDQNRLLILNNVDESGLVARERMGSMGGTAVSFNGDDILTNQYVSHAERGKKKCIIMVSRDPIRFGFHGTVTVNLSEYSVDDKEAETIVSHFLTLLRNMAQKSGGGVSNIRVSRNDIRKIGLVLEGMTHAQAMQLLSTTLQRVRTAGTDVIDGEKLWKMATEINNSWARSGAIGESKVGGPLRGCYYKNPKKTMDDYIRDKRTDWGEHVNKINDKIEMANEKIKRQEQTRQQIWEMDEAGKLPITERIAKEREVDQLDKEIYAELQGIPHFQILYGSAGCGKSVYPEAFAKKLGFRLVDVDFGQTRGGLVGQTETWSRALIESWKKMANVVIRMDEMDGQIASSVQERNESFNANVLAQLLSFFEENKDTLVKRNIFVFGTTNNPDRIRREIRDRAERLFVPEPYTVDGYVEFLNRACSIIGKENSMGFIYDPDSKTTSANLWPETQALMDTVKPDFPRIAEALVDTGMNFRQLERWLISMWDVHMLHVQIARKKRLLEAGNMELFKKEYPDSWEHDESGDHVKPIVVRGFPFTTENIIRACKLTYPTDMGGHRISVARRRGGVDGDIHIGVYELERQMTTSREEPEEAGAAGQMELGLAQAPAAEALDESVLSPPGDSVLASTDYYFDALVKSGIVGKDGLKQESARRRKPQPRTRGRLSAMDVGERGYYEHGTIALVPIPDLPTMWRKYISDKRRQALRAAKEIAGKERGTAIAPAN